MKRYAVLFALLAVVPCRGQLVEQFEPPHAGCCLPSLGQRLAAELQDWNQLGRYHADDERVNTQTVPPGRVVFLGDSITDGWDLEKYFPGKPYVNRGISGQTTPQMLVRLFPDVIDLHPATLIVLAGTNDIAQNTGPETVTMVEENFQAITELARAHGIKVILCSILPVSDYTQHPQTARRPPAQILALDKWIADYTAKQGLVYCDYYSAVVDDKGFLRQGDSDDGLHPNDAGYKLMAPVAAAAIERTLR